MLHRVYILNGSHCQICGSRERQTGVVTPAPPVLHSVYKGKRPSILAGAQMNGNGFTANLLAAKLHLVNSAGNKENQALI